MMAPARRVRHDAASIPGLAAMASTPPDLTVLLNRAADGQPGAAAEILPLVYQELRALAESRLRGEPTGVTLQATALVHEAFLRIADDRQSWEGRRHFFSAAAIAMRRILVERARARAGPKRGGGRRRVNLDSAAELSLGPTPTEPDWAQLDGALIELEGFDPSLVEVVHLRYFAGLSIDQTALSLGRSPRSVDRDWKCARAWLLDRLGRSEP
jgi:RNA polymerase sigma factor (TIGR02999 family)